MNPCDLTMSPAEGLSLGLGRQSRDFLKQNNQPFFFFLPFRNAPTSRQPALPAHSPQGGLWGARIARAALCACSELTVREGGAARAAPSFSEPPAHAFWLAGGSGRAEARSSARCRWPPPGREGGEAEEDGGSRGSGGAGLVLERAFLAAAQRDVGRPGRRAGRRAAVPAGEPRPLRLPAGARYLRRAAVVREVSAGPGPLPELRGPPAAAVASSALRCGASPPGSLSNVRRSGGRGGPRGAGPGSVRRPFGSARRGSARLDSALSPVLPWA